MTLLWILVVLLVAVGVAGTVLPAIPGVPLVFAGLVLAAWIDGFQKVGYLTLGILAVLTAGAFGIDLLASTLGAKKAGAGKAAVVGAAVGAVVGLFFSLPGLILGPFVGALAGELLAGKSWQQAGKAGLGTWLGMVLGAVAKLALTFTMLGLFALAWIL